MYSGIVFDFDGVLYDSEKHWYEIENRYLRTHMPAWNPDDYRYLIGHSLPEAYQFLNDKGLDLSSEDYFADYHAMAVDLYSNLATPLPGIDRLLKALTARKAKIGIASSSKRTWINTALESNKLPITISVIVSGDDVAVAQGKPAPDVYLRATQLLDEQPSKMIAIEDSRNGVVSAKSAGLYCFGLRNGFNEAQDLGDADEIIEGYSSESTTKIMDLIA